MKSIILLLFVSALICSCSNRKEELKTEIKKVISEQNLLIEEMSEYSNLVQDDLSHQIRLKTINEDFVLEGENLMTYVKDTTDLYNCKIKLAKTNEKLKELTKEIQALGK